MGQLRIMAGSTQILQYNKNRNKLIKQGAVKNANIDKIEISTRGKKSVSEAEKINNRRKIDFADGVVGYDCNSRVFTLPDGSRISADDVSTKIGENEYKTIQVDDNMLDLQPGNYYRLVGENGDITTFSCAKYGLSSYSISKSMLEDTAYSLEEDNKVYLLGCLAAQGNTIAATQLNSREWAVNILKDYGFTSGKIAIHIKGGNCGECYLDNDNRLYSVAETQSLIDGINLTNYLEEGISKDSVWRIGEKEYSMDENGYFHIPMDAMCIPGNMQLVDGEGNPVIIHNQDINS